MYGDGEGIPLAEEQQVSCWRREDIPTLLSYAESMREAHIVDCLPENPFYSPQPPSLRLPLLSLAGASVYAGRG